MTFTSNDFSSQNWNGRNLCNQNLSGYKLIRTQINGGNLRNSILDGADLEYAQLSGADLTNASLRGADLRNANLEFAQLENTDFRGANVQGTLFKHNTGLSEESKAVLKERGAIFNGDSITIDRKWWVEKVFIPVTALLIGSSGIVGVLQLLQQKTVNPHSPPPSIEKTQPPRR
ncbi:pentapeptide repeat-containing protein [Hassallia byssoidea VB512170]|uniref:Pentapeptide repeat-containing protein n=1 Tax=Hassallia byssoidea VB512170 TaxID=1304833 RepID=A0A846H046_9CYAN|nr:pentapeptide repeat-containing protein [Hassalia byssoidea]NEU71387.1 pentapeptide repeat-containing protein [Hassalia byssoidea VB512170]